MMRVVANLYDQDLVLWSQEQARALREEALRGSNARIDWENVAEEIESLGRSDRRAVSSHIAIVIEHLMRLQASPAPEPVAGWVDTILRARAEIEQLLEESPSLRHEVAAMIGKKLPRVRSLVQSSLRRHDEQPQIDLDHVTYTEDQVLGDWMPEGG